MDPITAAAAIAYVIVDVVRVASRLYNQGEEFFSDLESTKKILDSLDPLVKEMMRYNQLMDPHSPVIKNLQDLIDRGKELVQRCPKSWGRIFSSGYYGGRLRAWNKELMTHLTVSMQVQNTSYLMKIMYHVGLILKIPIAIENFEQFYGVQIEGKRGAPEEPEYCMGMDDHLSQLRMKLLNRGVSVLVLTGLAGSGKSTLAKKICWDRQVQEKFKTNIFFVTFSKTPNVKNIVKTLFENCDRPVPEFQNDEDAINQLGVLLRVVGRKRSQNQIVTDPILLVLDDVWNNSEALVEKFKIQRPDYKILVTSRFAFERFGIPQKLEPLDHDDAVSLFRKFAGPNVSSSYMPDSDLVNEIVRSCKGSPLLLEVIGGSLRNKSFNFWQNMKERLQNRPILKSTGLLCHLQQSLDDFPLSEKECFMDLGLFPEDQRIPVATLIDMWEELNNSLDDNDRICPMTIIDDFTTRNLVKLIVTRKVAEHEDMHYNNHFIALHDLVRELAALQGHQEPERRKKLHIELYDDKRPEWWVGQNPQAIFGRMFSFLSTMLIGKKQQRVAAQVLSISTDENFDSDWCDMHLDEAEVLILNLRSSQYSLPQFTKKMSKLKVLIVTNYGFYHSDLNEFELLGSLLNLKRIRLEKVTVPHLCKLKNLWKLSLYMCNTKQAFENSSIRISDAMPNLVEMSIDYCKDMVKLPDGICNIIPLKKLSITSCHKLDALPQDIANMKNLEVLRLSCCSKLKEMPESVKGLDMLRCLDISDCLSLKKLPEDIGELQKLKKLYMKGCSGLSDVPFSVRKFEHLNHDLYVFCDEERATLWGEHVHNIHNLKIEIPKEDIGLPFALVC